MKNPKMYCDFFFLTDEKMISAIAMRLLSIGYSTIETKEADRIGYNGFLFPHE
jgi:hypothetical protein